MGKRAKQVKHNHTRYTRLQRAGINLATETALGVFESQVWVVVVDAHTPCQSLLALQLDRLTGTQRSHNGRAREVADKLQALVVAQLPRQVQERLFEIEGTFGAQIVVLDSARPVPRDMHRLDLAILDVNFVADENNWDLPANTPDVCEPLGHILVRDAGRDVEHHDRAVSAQIVPIFEAAELFLPGGVPNIEYHCSAVRLKMQPVHVDTQCRDILVLELTGLVPFDQGRLAYAAVADEDHLELHDPRRRGGGRPFGGALAGALVLAIVAATACSLQIAQGVGDASSKFREHRRAHLP
mmetsp:Transcript_46374/g.148972  ORF Transcript_46374/g.148972 Transcript_46374/m.148972 type:complete len:298 (-) Transcript_46374:75-968(-)